MLEVISNQTKKFSIVKGWRPVVVVDGRYFYFYNHQMFAQAAKF